MTPAEWLEAEFSRDPYPERLGCHPRKLLTFVPCEEPDSSVTARWPVPARPYHDLDWLEEMHGSGWSA